MGGEHIQVEVHRGAGSDAVLAGQLRALRRGPAALLAGALLVVTGVASIVGLIVGAKGDEVETVAIVIGTLGFIAAGTVPQGTPEEICKPDHQTPAPDPEAGAGVGVIHLSHFRH
jgi:hypothetical protein